MNQIEKAIRDLSSPDKDTRYKACVELRLADSIPEPAIAALEAATHDPDPLVADAARLALASHEPSSTSQDQANRLKEQENSFPMNTKPRFPRSLYVICALIGGVIGILTFTPPYLQGKNDDPIVMFILPIMCISAVGISVLFGILAGRIGYAVKPRKWVSIGAAALGGAVPASVYLLLIGFSNLQLTLAINQQQQMYPEPKPIIPLPATFRELTSGENCSVSSDGSRLALESDGQINLWDLNQNKQIDEFPSQHKFLALSPDGLILALRDSSSHVILRDLETGEQLAQLDDVFPVAFSPDGRLMAANNDMPDGSSRIDLLDPSTAQEVAHIDIKEPFGIYSLAFSPDGGLLAAEPLDQITLWDTATLKRVGKLNTDGVVHSMAFSPDGSRLAVGNYQGQIDAEVIGLWDVNTQQLLVGIRAPETSWNIGFSPDGQKLITALTSGIYLWDANSLEPLGSLIKPLSEGSDAFFLPDGRVLACYYISDRIGIWTIESP